MIYDREKLDKIIKTNGTKIKYILVLFVLISSFILVVRIYFEKKPVNKTVEYFYTYQEDSNPSSISDDALISVHISGAISKPGVYHMDKGDLVSDLINSAGGLRSDASSAYVNKELNLARKLSNEEKIYIKTTSEYEDEIAQLGNKSRAKGEMTNKSNLVNINTASEGELESLPGIGPATAKKIIRSRPFRKIEDIKKVNGIGDAKFQDIKDRITV